MPNCPFCQSKCIRHGKSHNHNPRYKCKQCHRTHSKTYQYRACSNNTAQKIVTLLKESCGIRSIARILRIGVNTVIRKIRQIAASISKPAISLHQEYELDEMCTYIKSKTRKRWVVYAIRKDNKSVVDVAIGRRNNHTLRKVTDTLILSQATKIHTDKLRNYQYLIPEQIHSTKKRGINHIERKNLNLRTHLKRLSRRTICFTKRADMLIACVKIYFWG